MKKLFIALFVFTCSIGYSQTQTETEKIPEFAPFAYFSPTKDTLFLQANDANSDHIKRIWETDTLIKEPVPVIIMHKDVPNLIEKRKSVDWGKLD